MTAPKRKRGDHISERYRVLNNMHQAAARTGVSEAQLDRICLHVGHCLAAQASTATAFLVSQLIVAKGDPKAAEWADSLPKI